MKKIIAILLIATMLISISACGSKYDPYTDPDLNAPNVNHGDDNQNESKEPSVYDIIGKKAADYNFEKMSPSEFVGAMGLGWNLGNTFDATLGKYDDPKSQETSWGNPEVTQELIQTVADYGFTTIRIPITWYTYCDADYNINPDYLNRIKEVVDWALDAGLFVIINSHHECEAWLVPTTEKYEDTSDILCKIWSQVGEYFKDYNERLIFEGMNEPRVVGADWREWYGSQEWWDIVNQLGLDFVETIRSTGGNNSKRYLMVPCYAATSNAEAWRLYKFPENDERVIMSIHAYTPYDFALNTGGTSNWSSENGGDTREINNLFDEINRVFLRKGRVAVIGEFGALAKNGNVEAREDWAGYYISKAKEYGVPCIWWDNNLFNEGEMFGLIRREYNDCMYLGILETMFNTWYNSNYSFPIKEIDTSNTTEGAE